MNTIVNKQPALLHFFFYLVIIEIVVGGSGRLLEFGLFSLKMLFYGVAMLISFFSINQIKERKILGFQLYFIILVLIGFVFSAFNNADTDKLFEDIKPLLFVFLINFFAICITNMQHVKKVANVIKWSALVMAIVYLLTVLSIYLGFIDFKIFYLKENIASEILFRNELFFFYKGFLYLGIGFFFSLLSDKKNDKFIALILFTALCLTLTRGFILATALVFLFFVFFINKSHFLKLFTLVITSVAFVYLLPVLFDTLGDKSESDYLRIITTNQVVDAINMASFFFGHGFGIGVPIRPIHMEISFLEIFHKQGILGLLFWFSTLFWIIKIYIGIKTPKNKIILLPFILSVCYVFLQSFTNPFVNNPIGISIIILTIVCAVVAKKEDKQLREIIKN